MAAEASMVGVGSVSSSREFGITNEDTKKYEESVQSTKIVTIGSRLPEKGKSFIFIDLNFIFDGCNEVAL